MSNETNKTDWHQTFYGEFYEPLNGRLLTLADKYYNETEAYDRTVCTGPIRHGAIMPTNGQELGLINCNAKIVLKDILYEASIMGFDSKQTMSAIRNVGISS